MNKKIKAFEIMSLIFTFVLAFVNHNLFQWTNNCNLIASFVPVNESVWEHTKLFFFPFLFFSIFEYFVASENKNFVFAKSIPLIFGIPLMIILFYTYSGIIGGHNLVCDIIISIIVVLIMNYFSYKTLTSKKDYNSKWLIFLVMVIFVLFIIFTYFPPKIQLFLDTTTGKYGIQ